jgi:acyl carrier protein
MPIHKFQVDPHATTTDNIAPRLKAVLIHELGFPLSPERIREETSLYGKGLGLDSVDVITLITRLEEEFDIFFGPEEIGPSVKTFGSLLGSVREKLNHK